MTTKADKKAAERMLEDLINTAQEEVEFEKFGKKWTVRMINTEDNFNILKASSQYQEDPVARVFKSQVDTLRSALVAVEGIRLTPAQIDDFLSRVNLYILNGLFEEYDKVVTQKNKELNDLDESNNVETIPATEKEEKPMTKTKTVKAELTHNTLDV